MIASALLLFPVGHALLSKVQPGDAKPPLDDWCAQGNLITYTKPKWFFFSEKKGVQSEVLGRATKSWWQWSEGCRVKVKGSFWSEVIPFDSAVTKIIGLVDRMIAMCPKSSKCELETENGLRYLAVGVWKIDPEFHSDGSLDEEEIKRAIQKAVAFSPEAFKKLATQLRSN